MIHAADHAYKKQRDAFGEINDCILDPGIATKLGFNPTDTLASISNQAQTALVKLESSEEELTKTKELIVGKYAGRIITVKVLENDTVGSITGEFGHMKRAIGVIDNLDLEDCTSLGDFHFSILAPRRRGKFNHIQITPYNPLFTTERVVDIRFLPSHRNFPL